MDHSSRIILSFGYVGMVLAMRSNKDDFSLIIRPLQGHAENFIVLDTNVIIDGRIADLIEGRFIEGIVVVPKFILKRASAHCGLFGRCSSRPRSSRAVRCLNRLQQNPRCDVRIHQTDFPAMIPWTRVCPAGPPRWTPGLYERLQPRQGGELQSSSPVIFNEMRPLSNPRCCRAMCFTCARPGRARRRGRRSVTSRCTMVVVNRASLPAAGRRCRSSLVQNPRRVIIFA